MLDIEHSYKQASESRSIHRQFAFGGDGRVIEKQQKLQHFPFGSGAEEGQEVAAETANNSCIACTVLVCGRVENEVFG